MEKQIMTEPMEEFITDMPQPSIDKSAEDAPVTEHVAEDVEKARGEHNAESIEG